MTAPLQRRANAPWLFALCAIVALFVAHASRRWAAVTPDVAVTVAYAQNLAEGHGLVLNAGAERVERAPSLLWTVAIAPASALGLSTRALAQALGAALATVAIVLAAFVPSQMRARAPRWLDLLAPLVCASMSNYAIAAVSGAEHGLLAALTAAALLALAREERDAEAFPWSALWLVLAFVARPDAAVFALAIGAAKLLRNLAPKRPRRQDVLWVLSLAAGVFAVTLFRLAYFAAVLPAAYRADGYSLRSALFVGRAEALAQSSRWLAEHKLSTLAWLAVAAVFGPSPHAARLAIIASTALALLSAPAFDRAAPDHRALATAALLLALAIGEGGRAVVVSASWLAPRAARHVARAALTAILALLLAWRASSALVDGTTTTITPSPPTIAPEVTRALAIDGRPTLFTCGAEPQPYDGRFVESELHDDALASIDELDHELPALIDARGPCAFARPIIDALYLRIGSSNAFVHRALVAAPYAASARRVRASVEGAPDGVTLSHERITPGATLLVELSLSRAPATTRTSLALFDERGALVEREEINAFGALIDGERLMPGERPRVRVALRAPREGRYDVRWTREDGASVALGSITVTRTSFDPLEQDVSRAIIEDRFDQGWSAARGLSLRIAADPLDPRARDALSRFTRAMVERARAAADAGALSVAGAIAHAARALAPFDRGTLSLCGEVAERLADAAIDAERGGDWTRAFELASSAVRVDPRRSWSRRRAEATRARRARARAPDALSVYRDAAGALASGDPAELDRVIVRMADAGHPLEAARLAERSAHTPRDPHARVAVARGLLSQARAREAVALVSGVPCREARDIEVTRALRAIMGASAYRPFDEACAQAR